VNVTLADGGTIAYEVTGAGPPILLIRPMVGSMRVWGRFREALEQRMQVIAFDARGVGGSSPAPLDTSTRTMARDALAVLDAAGVAQANVFGISLGGMVASWIAIDAAPRVRKLVLASTLPAGEATGLVRSVRGLAKAAGLAQCLLGDEHESARCLAKKILSPMFQVAHREEARRLIQMFEEDGIKRRSVLAFVRAGATHDVREHLDAIAAPTLVLCGGLDPVITVESQKKLLVELRDVTFDVIPQSGHAIDSEQPLALAARVLAFCAYR
jgi:pimeloyl-ACP methyl ester carboxylesterase